MTTKQIQHLLAYLGYYKGSVDGLWGALSTTACRAFQQDFRGIQVDGSAGIETQQALKHAVAYGITAQDTPESSTPWNTIRYFTREEFRCKCGGKYCSGFPRDPDIRMVRLADTAREYFGRPGHVISGLRCSQWNTLQGGVANSQHQFGEACDIRIDNVSADDLLMFFKQQPEVRYCYKINDTNVHFDVPKGDR